MIEISRTKTREQALKEYYDQYYLLRCPHCGTELIVAQSELHLSNDNKGLYKNIKCCYCGCVWDELVGEMYEKRCNIGGIIQK